MPRLGLWTAMFALFLSCPSLAQFDRVTLPPYSYLEDHFLETGWPDPCTVDTLATRVALCFSPLRDGATTRVFVSTVGRLR